MYAGLILFGFMVTLRDVRGRSFPMLWRSKGGQIRGIEFGRSLLVCLTHDHIGENNGNIPYENERRLMKEVEDRV